jgi:hypothetical protein
MQAADYVFYNPGSYHDYHHANYDHYTLSHNHATTV